jgi:hypothetical protein
VAAVVAVVVAGPVVADGAAAGAVAVVVAAAVADPVAGAVAKVARPTVDRRIIASALNAVTRKSTCSVVPVFSGNAPSAEHL